MRFASGCLLSRAAILTSLLIASEQGFLEQRLGSGPINKGGSRRSDADRSAAGLDLDRERPWWTSHQHFGVNGRDKSSPACVGSMILRRQARQASRDVHGPSHQPQIDPASECGEVATRSGRSDQSSEPVQGNSFLPSGTESRRGASDGLVRRHASSWRHAAPSWVKASGAAAGRMTRDRNLDRR